MTEWTDPQRFARVIERTATLETGHYAEFFAEGDVIEHEPGLTLSRWGTERWMSQTLNHDPTYWRSDCAASNDYDEPPIHPDYLLAATLGVTVEDLSEKGGYFLGRTDVRFHRDVYPGTELAVESEVLSVDESRSRPSYAIVTWRTRGTDAATDEVLCSYERTNMIPRREPARADDPRQRESESDADGAADSAAERTDEASGGEPSGPFLTPDGPFFEDFVDALEVARDRNGVVAYQHERGRTIDDVMVASLPLSTLNTAKQHHNVDAMADSPSGDVVAYGDVTRSIALGHARSDEATYRDLGFTEERFHTFVTPGDTIYAFTRVLEIDDAVPPATDGTAANSAAPASDRNTGGTDEATHSGDSIPADLAGTVRFHHVAFNQKDEPAYSGYRTAAIRKRLPTDDDLQRP